MRNNPRVSIGLPVYNGEHFIREALDSILAQTFEDFELIISDNASTDATQDICLYYVKRDKRIRYYRNDTNLGAARNFNRVFELATGEYFKWASYDDVCRPLFFEECVKILDEKPSVILCHPRTAIINEYGNLTGETFEDDLHLCQSSSHERYSSFLRQYSPWGLCFPIFGVIRRSTLAMTPLIRSFIGSDMVLLGELSLRGEFHEVPQCLFYRRDHAHASVRAHHRAHTEMSAWFDTKQKRKRIYLPTWRWLFEYLRTISRFNLKWMEKMSCFKETLKWLVRNRKRFKRELVSAIKLTIRNILIHSRVGKVILETRKRLVKQSLV